MNARNFYRSALTLSGRDEREQAFADTFRALGQVMHLIADASVPAHARNDQHIGGEPYEKWVESRATPRGGEASEEAQERFLATFLPVPPAPPDAAFILGLTILGQDASDAPVPIARLWDTDQYDGANPSITVSDRVGISEYANANFFSADTVFVNGRSSGHKHFSPFPSGADVEVWVDATNNRKYWRARRATSSEAQYLATVSKRLFWGAFSGVDLPPRGGLDEKVHEDYTKLLLPRAVGYSAALLDYFFRGQLDVDVVEDEDDPSLVRLTGSNASSETLGDGILAVYADDSSGRRAKVSVLDPMIISNVEPDGEIRSARFQAPEHTERFVAVYEGTLGQEVGNPERQFPGAVIGQVLGGVRVEEVFADHTRWKLRTPRGVFHLPIRAAEFDDVRWGDGDNVLVARTPLGPDEPSRVVAYEVQRQPGSVDLRTVDTPEGPEVRLEQKREAVFPFGISLGTAVQFEQTVQYTQHVATYDRTTVFRWEPQPTPFCPACGRYLFDHNEFGSLQIESAVTETLSFTQKLSVVLDAAHNGAFGRQRTPYQWFLREVAADAVGRLVGVVAVFLNSHAQTGVILPLIGVNPSSGPGVAGQVTVAPSFPFVPETLLLWALVDLEAGRVIASTVEPVVRVFTHEAQEGPFVVARHSFVRREGGPQAGLEDVGWSEDGGRQHPWAPIEEPTELLTQEGMSELSINGEWRAEFKDELTRLGLSGTRLSSSQTLRDVPFGCESQDLAIPSCRVIRVVISRSEAGRTLQLETARRARPAPAAGAERLVFLLAGGTILVWDPFTPKVHAVLHRSRDVVDFLGAATGAAVLVTFFSLETFDLSSLVLSLAGTREPIVFPGEDLSSSFRLLNPSHLYHLTEMRFYRLEPPLQRTALPAKLGDGPGSPRGDYHVIQLP